MVIDWEGVSDIIALVILIGLVLGAGFTGVMVLAALAMRKWEDRRARRGK